MTTYIIRRLLLVPILLIGVTILIFGMMQLLSPVERTALYLKDFPKNDKAIELFNALLADNPGEWIAYRGRGDVELNIGQRAKAIDFTAIRLTPPEHGCLAGRQGEQVEVVEAVLAFAQLAQAQVLAVAKQEE